MQSKKQVPFFNYSHIFCAHEAEFMETITSVCRKGAFILQKELEEFEKELATFLNVKHAIGVADGTEAIVLALQAAGVKPGDEVIVPSHTFIATVSAIHFIGATPILVECGEDHMVDPQAVERAVTNKTRAIVPVHLNGRTCDMASLKRIAASRDLLIVEDAAQAVGSKFDGVCAGTFGSAGTFSFYPAKSLGGFGDGGGLVTNNDQVAETVKILRDHGRDASGEISQWGYNCRLDNLQAAILSIKLKYFPQEIVKRRELAAQYHECLSTIAEVKLPPAPQTQGPHFDTFQNFEVEANKREELRAYLKENGVGTLLPWGGKAVHQFKKLNLEFDLPRTDELFRKCILLPMNTSLTNEDVMYVSEVIKSFYCKS